MRHPVGTWFFSYEQTCGDYPGRRIDLVLDSGDEASALIEAEMLWPNIKEQERALGMLAKYPRLSYERRLTF